MKTVYRIHLNGGDHDYPTLKEAKRQAQNIANASGIIVGITKERIAEIPSPATEAGEGHGEAREA
jgi:hypothetical protein